jgi:SNF2 family DNA or RNA helicase
MGLKDQHFEISYGPSDDRLCHFYIPALAVSVRYDRSAGYFSSSALAIAAQGVAHLVKNGGKMRLLVGAQLDKADVEAIRSGHDLGEQVTERLLQALEKPEDKLKKARLEVLAWMVAEGNLEIKVVLPTDEQGRVLPAPDNQEYYHPKEGIFTDARGEQICFSGSVNESEQGWKNNYEQFNVFTSWGEGKSYIKPTVERFERLWEDREVGWVSMPVPNAVAKKLLRYRPSSKPVQDPLEIMEEEVDYSAEEDQRERLTIEFLKNAPLFPNSNDIGIVTSAVSPWPHQVDVIKKVLARFPERFLLCDEVGLGKTIEAGLVLRQLYISGKVLRCLLLVPKSVAKQWQEELYEKFALQVPFYSGVDYTDVFGSSSPARTNNPWDAYPIVLASSHLAKRKDRQEQLLQARPWDLVIVDEAHHARRKDFLDERFRPNRLLELLRKLSQKTDGMLLLTATPMQINPVEVWDLLSLLDIGGKWGAHEHYFVRYFKELRLSPKEMDWQFLLSMLSDYLNSGGEIDEDFARKAEADLGPVDWELIKSLPQSHKQLTTIKQLSAKALYYLAELLKTHTPLRSFSFRNTRRLLKEYRKAGLLKERVPEREPTLEWIEMNHREQELYERIEDYISNFYQKYEAERRGLGFIMTVYRKRLTSSFYAMERSMGRRLEYLNGLRGDHGLVDDDVEDDLNTDFTEQLEEHERSLFLDEVSYVEDFLSELCQLKGETKAEKLLEDLDKIFRRRDTVIIFTQYTDTMDYLREKLRDIYGSQVACYSGRGGERWDGTTWAGTTKEAIKTAFMQGDDVKILVCTDAASEGLNLQSCGVLINYDMLWNPMRVEQRIGRIDRIGQKYERVWIKNYFYENTVEARVYRSLSDRISWFEDVVGELQPILAKVEDSIRKIAMSRKEERMEELNREINAITEDLDTRDAIEIDLDKHLEPKLPERVSLKSPITMAQLEEAVLDSSALQKYFRENDNLPGSYLLNLNDKEHIVTFDSELFDRYPNSLQFLTYANPIFNELLDKLKPAMQEEPWNKFIRCQSDLPMIAYYTFQGDDVKQILDYAALQRQLENDFAKCGNWPKETVAKAENDFNSVVKKHAEQRRKVYEKREKAKFTLFRERGLQLLLRAALVLDRLENKEDTISFGLEQRIHRGFKLLLKRKYPFTSLMKILDLQTIDQYSYISGDDFSSKSDESLKAYYHSLREQIEEILNAIVVATMEK